MEDGARGVFMVPVLHHVVLAHKPEHVYAITQHQFMEGQGASVPPTSYKSVCLEAVQQSMVVGVNGVLMALVLQLVEKG